MIALSKDRIDHICSMITSIASNQKDPTIVDPIPQGEPLLGAQTEWPD
jgi:hypothetical protein